MPRLRPHRQDPRTQVRGLRRAAAVECGRFSRGANELEKERFRKAGMFLLRQAAGPGEETGRRPRRLYMRRVRRTVQRHRRGDRGSGPGASRSRHASQTRRDQIRTRSVRDRAGRGEEDPLRRGVQPLQTHHLRCGTPPRRGRARQEQHPPHRPHGYRKDAARADAGAPPQGSVCDRRCHDAHRGGIRRRGRGEYPSASHPQRRRRHQTRRDGDHLCRRDRQDLAQERKTRRSRATCRARACSRRS